MRLVEVFVATVILGACGGGGAASVALDDYAETYDQWFCDYEVQCGYATDAASCYHLDLTTIDRVPDRGE